jgi:cysteine-rich repeat protein
VRIAYVLIVAFTLSACFESELYNCGDDRVCPVGYTCTPTFQCLSPAETGACEDLVDGDACVIGGVDGTCQEGGCKVAACGNSVVDAGEVCDDGNQASGDGCNGTCTSDESCGNGFLELDEECDCGDVDHPGPARCEGTSNGGALCTDACHQRRCGDGMLDPGEVCDDGNAVPGDGCNFDCSSTEACGNGILDYFVGEQCDDGANVSRDGCSSTCLSETLTWERTQPDSPPATQRCAMTYDVARDRVVALAGPTCGQTWELEGTTWSQREPLVTPPNRIRPALAYDARRGRVVMFGGEASSTAVRDTWEYDGITWTKRVPPASPPARTRASMAFDLRRGVIVLFGGHDNLSTWFDDTWEYDGTTWTQRSLGTHPSGRHGAVMAYDAVRGRMVLFGGFLGGIMGPITYDETWECDGTAWTKASPDATAPARESAMMVFDTSRSAMVLFGGAAAGGTPLSDTWTYNGTTWSDLAPPAPPNARRDGGLAYVMGTRQRVVLYGGGTVGTTYSDTYELVDTTWVPISTPTSPTARSETALAYDAARGKVVMFGGSTGASETWELDALGIWTKAAPTTSPPPRTGAAMAYDPVNRQIVLFGGRSSGELADTWVYDGVTWEDVTPTTSPPPRTVASMVFDRVRGRIVMFGGRYTSGVTIHRDDTWLWDGNAWTPLTLSTSPQGRGNAGMVYDAARSRIVLYGGRVGTGTLTGDTWFLDSTASAWTPTTLLAGPPSTRPLQALAYDEPRGRVVLLSGTSDGFDQIETWELDPTEWVQRTTTTSPSSRTLTAVTYDAAESRIVLFGGIAAISNNETWQLSFASPSRSEACNAGVDTDGDGQVGCADSECWAVCTPVCPPSVPASSCPTAPACGDGVCTAIEDCHSCSADCAADTPVCPVTCGDTHCDTGETAVSCPGDCS